MNKVKLNYFIDVLLAISFFTCFFTGLVKWLGIAQSRNSSALHNWSGLIMGLLIFVHLVLHWGWIVAVTKSFFKSK
jgi:hypothetical protein